jgi:hypothetical protein
VERRKNLKMNIGKTEMVFRKGGKVKQGDRSNCG